MAAVATLYWLVRAAVLIWCVERRDVVAEHNVHHREGIAFGVRYSRGARFDHLRWSLEERLWRVVRLPYPQGGATEDTPHNPCGCKEVD